MPTTYPSVPFNISPFLSGQSLQANSKRINALSIIVSPVISPTEGTVSGTQSTTVSISAVCPAEPGTYLRTYSITDPSGQADSGSFEVELTCSSPSWVYALAASGIAPSVDDVKNGIVASGPVVYWPSAASYGGGVSYQGAPILEAVYSFDLTLAQALPYEPGYGYRSPDRGNVQVVSPDDAVGFLFWTFQPPSAEQVQLVVSGQGESTDVYLTPGKYSAQFSVPYGFGYQPITGGTVIEVNSGTVIAPIGFPDDGLLANPFTVTTAGRYRFTTNSGQTGSLPVRVVRHPSK